MTCSVFQVFQAQLWWEVKVRIPCRFLGPHRFSVEAPSACTTPNSPSHGPGLKPQKMGSFRGFPYCRETKPQTKHVPLRKHDRNRKVIVGGYY